MTLLIPDAPTLFLNARLIDGHGGKPVKKAAVLVEGTKITKVGKTADFGESPNGNMRVLDLEGRPVAGVKVTVRDVGKSKAGDLTAYVEAYARINRGVAIPQLSYLPVEVLGEGRVATTGKDGRFRVTGVGRERSVSLYFEGRGIETQWFSTITRPGMTLKTGYFRGPSFDLLVGPDLLAGYALDIDYPAHRFRLLPSGRLPFRGTTAPLRTSPITNVYLTDGRLNGQPLHPLVVDTGDGSMLTLSARAWRRAEPDPPPVPGDIARLAGAWADDESKAFEAAMRAFSSLPDDAPAYMKDDEAAR